MFDKKHKQNHKPAPNPREVRRQNIARYGSTMTPEGKAADPEKLAAALAMCASAGLPEPTILMESYGPPEDNTWLNIYVFAHIRVPQIQFRAEESVVAAYPERTVQICKGAGIITDALLATDDPEPALVA